MAVTLKTTPRADGYLMPGEFTAHARTWMLWPERPDNWRESAKPAQRAFAEVAAAISMFEPVTVGANPTQLETARTMLPAQVRVVEIPNNDSWMRDCGPTFVVNTAGQQRLVDWMFNAWGGLEGGLYAPWDLDDRVPQAVSEIEGVDRYEAPIVLEGGSIHVDGEGTLITTEECLLNPNRNPSLSREEIEAVLKEYTGVSKILWLGKGVFNDETDGHVDNLCAFLRPGVVALTWTEDSDDPQYSISKDAFGRLSEATDACGRKLEIHKINQPQPILISEAESGGVLPTEGTLPRRAGDRMAASYVNFYICNGGVIVPTFSDPHDRDALETLQELMPMRKVVGVAAREILLGGGNIHCITQQQPSGN